MALSAIRCDRLADSVIPSRKNLRNNLHMSKNFRTFAPNKTICL